MDTQFTKFKALIVDANGEQQIVSLAELAKMQLMPGMKVSLVDAKTGKPVENMVLKKDGNDLVLEVEGEGEVVRLEDAYSGVEQISMSALPVQELTGMSAGDAATGAAAGAEAAAYSIGATEVIAGALLIGVAAAAGGGSSSDSVDPAFTVFEGEDGFEVEQLSMGAGDELVAVRDEFDEIIGFNLNDVALGEDAFEALQQLEHHEQDEDHRPSLNFDSLTVDADGTHVAKVGGEKLELYLGSVNDVTPNVVGALYVEREGALLGEDGADVEISSGNNAVDGVYADLESVSVISEGDAELQFSNHGGDNFLESLRTIYVESTGSSSSMTAELEISASTNYNWSTGELATGLGDNFMSNLESITIVGSDNASASLSVSHSGGEYFMESLRTIEISSVGENNSADVSISASANTIHNPDQSLSGDEVELPNHYFMPELESISVVSDDYHGSLSLSHSGGSYFMQSLETMHVSAGGRAEISISASANFEGANNGHFMQSLGSITVESTGEQRASLSISVTGSEYFMQELEEITITGGLKAVLDISNSESNFSTTGIESSGDNFMEMLQTVTVESDGGVADVRLSNDDGDNFLSQLSEINLQGDSAVVDLAGPMGNTTGTLTIDLTQVGGDGHSLAMVMTSEADFGVGATTVLVTEIGTSDLQYNAIFDTDWLSLSDVFLDYIDSNDNDYEVYLDVGSDNDYEVYQIIAGDYAGYGGSSYGPGDDVWLSLGSNDVKDLFRYTEEEMGDAIIGGFDDGLDQIDFSQISTLFSGTINDQSTVNGHVATDLGDILVTQADEADDAIIWLNTAGGTTTGFEDFEASIYIVDGSTMDWDAGGNIIFGTV